MSSQTETSYRNPVWKRERILEARGLKLGAEISKFGLSGIRETNDLSPTNNSKQ